MNDRRTDRSTKTGMGEHSENRHYQQKNSKIKTIGEKKKCHSQLWYG